MVIMAVSGCKTMSLSYTAEEPTAEPELVKKVQEEFALHSDDIKVSDQGLISYVASLPSSGYKWNRAVMVQQGYKFSCVDLISLLEQGFVTKLHFKGKGGSYDEYDYSRCQQEASN